MRKNRQGLAVMVLCAVLFPSCGGARTTRGGEAQSTQKELLQRVAPLYGTSLRPTEQVQIRFETVPGVQPDSVVLSIGGMRVGVIDTAGYCYTTLVEQPLGRVAYQVKAYRDGQDHTLSGEFTVMADRPPVRYGYRVVKSYPHDTEAYTQGLLYHAGQLYESTGLYGESSLRRVALASGEVLQRRELEQNYFGEGLVLLGDRLYQLTWQNGEVKVYNQHTFEPIRTFYYPGEGWGITTDGTYLYMSDGTEKIRVLDPETFTQVRTIEVYTNQKKVTMLNELEWIGGEIWANIYTSDLIARIDPRTGAVTGVIDLVGLLPASERGPQTDVLNGIAHDSASGRIWVTGKNWSQLFEIELLRKGQ